MNWGLFTGSDQGVELCADHRDVQGFVYTSTNGKLERVSGSEIHVAYIGQDGVIRLCLVYAFSAERE